MGRSFRGTQESGREAVASKVHQFSEEKDTGERRRWQAANDTPPQCQSCPCGSSQHSD